MFPVTIEYTFGCFIFIVHEFSNRDQDKGKMSPHSSQCTKAQTAGAVQCESLLKMGQPVNCLAIKGGERER